MNTTHVITALKECSARSSRLLIPLNTTIARVRVVDLSLYLPTRDTQRTLRLSGPRARVHSLACEQQQEGALLAQPVQGVGDLVTLAAAFMMMWL
jgi:hypothetical protein